VSGPTLILLLRHGQSEWNALQRWQGTADPPLNELGRRQAQFVASVLADQGHVFAGVWASNLARAADTAAIIAGVLDLGPVQVEAGLREADVGEWEGMTSGEISAAWPGYLEARRRPPGFEPFESVVARVIPALHRVAGGENPEVARLVVAHSGVIRTLVSHLGHVDARVPNLGGVWLAVDPAAAGPTITLAGRFDPSGEAGYSLDTPEETPVAER
jgi:broad specificity phosphatase PhoE